MGRWNTMLIFKYIKTFKYLQKSEKSLLILCLDWFQGWPQHNNYNRQPNDDGLSQQNCIEMRRQFQLPVVGGFVTTSSATESFMWNDRGNYMNT